jgi:hypothetical protein
MHPIKSYLNMILKMGVTQYMVSRMRNIFPNHLNICVAQTIGA